MNNNNLLNTKKQNRTQILQKTREKISLVKILNYNKLSNKTQN